MKKRVSKSEFKARALDLLRQVERSGESVIVTHRGQPVVEIRKFTNKTSDALEVLRGSVLFYERPLDPVGEEDREALSETNPR